MSETIYNEEQKKSSLLPNRVIISQVPTKYEIQPSYGGLESLSSCLNSRSTGIVKSEKEEPLQINQKICEGLGCYEKIATGIEVSAGMFGMISLFLCRSCAAKFTDKKVVV